MAIDPALAAELRDRLTRPDGRPVATTPSPRASAASLGGVRGSATPRDAGPDWDAAWDAALLTWMGVANLEERTAAAGWIDPAVLTSSGGDATDA